MAAPIQFNDVANFPLGARIFGTMMVPGTSGRTFFVDSTATATNGNDTNHGNTPQAPFATVAYAVTQVVANRGDEIHVLPGHTETLTAADAINLAVAGTRIVGRGTGRGRPIFTLASSTNASITVNDDNCSIENCVIDMTGIDGIGGGGQNGGIKVLAEDFLLLGCEIILATTGNQASCAIFLSTGANRCRILYNEIQGSATAGPVYGINIFGVGSVTCSGIEIGWNRISGDFSGAGIMVDMSDILTNIFIHDNKITATGSAQKCLAFDIDDVGCTGIIANNRFLGTDVTTVYTSDVGMANIENYGYDINTSGVQGVLVPFIGTQLPENASLVDQIIQNEFGNDRANYIPIIVDFSSGTWNTIGKHEILTVTGTVRLRIIPVGAVDLTSSGGATLQLGDEDTTNTMIAATTATDIDQDEVWLSTTPAKSFAVSGVIDRIVVGLDIGFEIAIAALTGGTLVFHCWWEPISSSGAVVAGAGGSL